MFIQVIKAKTSRQDEARALMQEWNDVPNVPIGGPLGGTLGFTDDGTFIGVVRFESREIAMANSRSTRDRRHGEEDVGADGRPTGVLRLRRRHGVAGRRF